MRVEFWCHSSGHERAFRRFTGVARYSEGTGDRRTFAHSASEMSFYMYY